MNIITVLQSFIELLTNEYGMGANPWLGGSPHPRRRARGQTPAVSTLLTPVSLCFRIRRRPETGDRFEIRERQSGYRCMSFSPSSHFTDNVLLHRWFTLRRRGMTVPRNSLVGGCGRHLQVTIINKLYRRVRQGELPVRAREGALGYDLGAPH